MTVIPLTATAMRRPSLKGDPVACDHEGGAPLRHDLLAFLRKRGAAVIRHSDRTLMDHLVGTHDLLRRWGASAMAQHVGLMHSVFGTPYFGRAIAGADDVDEIVSLIGAEATALVFMFSRSMKGKAFLEAVRSGSLLYRTQAGHSVCGVTFVPVSPFHMEILAAVQCANLLDQGKGLAEVTRLIAACKTCFSEPFSLSGELFRSETCYPGPTTNACAA
ncbi:hypothetical protein KR767_17425 [Luteibacter anthropi]|uniref:DUF6817 domain-containing protein n=1 Tax=Luteibacter anthropi TaxID=564369 RepID=UPI0020323306|nr:hypothetical protein [Luteibacter anthropi]URX61817.1 hypothetical protein KR767_17425 [Luteibacter anthropi]